MNFLRTTSLCLLCWGMAGFFNGALMAQDAPLGNYVFQVLLVDDADYSTSQVSQPSTELKFESDGEVFTVQAQSHGLSSLFSYEGAPELVFFKEVVGDEGEMIRQPIVRANLGESGRRVVFIRKSKTGKCYSSVLKVDPSFFQENHLRIQNLSNQVVRAKVSNRIEDLSSLAGHDFAIELKQGPPVVELLMAAYDGERAYVIENKNYVFRQGNRKIILLYNDPKQGNQVRYSSINIVRAPSTVVNVSDEKTKQVDVSGYYKGGRTAQSSGPDGPSR